jgi:hypothetical protein
MRKILPVLWLFALILSACTTAQAQTEQPGDGVGTPTGTALPVLPNPTATTAPSETSPSTTTPVATATTKPSATPNYTATPDTRLKPEQWQIWPVVPEITNRVYEIYQLGQDLGNDPHRFTKIGDCQSVRAAMMGLFDVTDSYNLTEETEYLQETIDWFHGSYNRDGYAVKGGYNAAAVLSPIWADPQVCLPGENPVECEVRLHKPSFAIISLEIWWEGRTPDRYEEYMRQIIDYLLEHGVVPILSTKADNVEGNHAINLITAELAYEYDLPLWNFWLAVQPLPNHGLDDTDGRDDGFHISYDAWTVRSYTALMALDSVWKPIHAQQ